jgi:hypothetical protein
MFFNILGVVMVFIGMYFFSGIVASLLFNRDLKKVWEMMFIIHACILTWFLAFYYLKWR